MQYKLHKVNTFSSNFFFCQAFQSEYFTHNFKENFFLSKYIQDRKYELVIYRFPSLKTFDSVCF